LNNTTVNRRAKSSIGKIRQGSATRRDGNEDWPQENDQRRRRETRSVDEECMA